MKKNYIIILFLVINTTISGQIVLTPGGSASAMLSAFIGSGLTISNATINCPSNAYGTFTNGNTTTVGINNGIILTTGSISAAAGPDSGPNTSVCNNTSINDPEIMSLEAQATYDPCILEFDFVPQCDSLTMKFVFGSEEYPEFVGSVFNDVFGFFITGPNPSGGNYTNFNIARLPNTTICSINTINGSSNSTFFIDNTGGATIQYDGLTTQIISTLSLTPCATYHFKIAIADAGDCNYDSGVFIDFFQCANPINLSVVSTASSCNANDGTATVSVTNGFPPFSYSWSPAPGGGQGTNSVTGLSGGVTYTVTVNDSYPCSNPDTAIVTIGGTPNPVPTIITNGATTFCAGGSVALDAGNGFASYLWSNGATSQTIIVTSAGSYSVTVTDANGCTGTSLTSVTVSVNPPPVPIITASGATAFCSGGSVNLDAGVGYATYLWSNGATSQTINISASGSYSVTVTDANGCIGSSTANAVITVNPNPSPTISATGSTTLCSGGSVTLDAGASFNAYSWSNGATGQTINVVNAGTYSVTVTDVNGCIGTSSILITLNPLPVADTASVIMTPSNCGGSTGGITGITMISGQTPFQYQWINLSGAVVGTNVDLINVMPGIYTLTVTDGNGCSIIIGPFTIISSPTVTAQFTTNYLTGATPLTVNFTNNSIGASNYIWHFGTGDSSVVVNPSYIYTQLGVYKVCLTAISSIGCVDTACSVINIYLNSVFIIPNIFSPNGDNVNDIFTIQGVGLKTMNAEIFNRWGQKIYEWYTINGGWDGRSGSGIEVSDGTYYFIINATDIENKKYFEKGFFNLVR